MQRIQVSYIFLNVKTMHGAGIFASLNCVSELIITAQSLP